VDLDLYIGRAICKFPPVGGMRPTFLYNVNRDVISYEFYSEIRLWGISLVLTLFCLTSQI
jgi:hypothetical protein